MWGSAILEPKKVWIGKDGAQSCLRFHHLCKIPKVQLFTSQSTVERSMAGLDRSRDTARPGVGAVVAVEGPWDVASSV